jgi:hypothetical protein
MPATYPRRNPVTIGVACCSRLTAIVIAVAMSMSTVTTTYASSAASNTAAPPTPIAK